jgi:hypothetical protein
VVEREKPGGEQENDESSHARQPSQPSMASAVRARPTGSLLAMMIGLNEALHRRRVLLWIAMVVCAMGIALATSHPHGPGADADAPTQHSLSHALCGLGEVLCAIALLVGFVLIGVRRLRGPPWSQIARAACSIQPSHVLSPRPPSLLVLSRLQR